MTSPRLLRTVLASVALLVPLTVQPAHADGGASVGQATYSPGLPTTGCISNMSIQKVATLVLAGELTGTYSYAFSGNSTSACESLTSGSGIGTVSGDVTGTLSYTRTGAWITYTGTVVIGGRHLVYTEHCVEGYGSFSPVTVIIAETCAVVTVF